MIKSIIQSLLIEKKGDPKEPWHVSNMSDKSEDLHKKLSNESIEQSEKHKHSHEKHVRWYKDDSEEYNTPLRYEEDETPDFYKDHVHHMDHVTSHKTKHDFHMYRGLSIHEGSLKDYPVGSIHHDKGYTGGTLHRNTAKGFTTNRTIARIHVPKGTKGHYLDNENRIEDESPNSDEQEFLLHRGTKFKVTGHSTDGHHHYVHMKVHSQND